MSKEHHTCRRRVMNIVERLSYELYTLKLYGKDKCPTAGVDRKVTGLITKAEKLVGQIRRTIRENPFKLVVAGKCPKGTK